MSLNLIMALRRKARKPHRCDGNWSTYCENIAKGEIYLEAVGLPGIHPIATNAGRPVRLHICAYCAYKVGRGKELKPLHPTFNMDRVFTEFRTAA